MRFRLRLGAVLVCASFVAATPVAGAAPKHVYKGKTGQKQNVSIVVRGNSLQVRNFRALLRCRNGERLTVIESGFVRTPLRRGGRFSDVQVGKTDEVRFKGRVSAKRIQGRLRVNDRLGKRKVRCSSPWVKFRAVRR